MIVCLAFDPQFDKGLGHVSRLVAIAQFLEKNDINYCFHSNRLIDSSFQEFIFRNGLAMSCTCDHSPDLTLLDSYNPSLPEYFSRSLGAPIILLADEVTPISGCLAVIEASPIPETKKYLGNLPILKFDRSPIFRREVYECLLLERLAPAVSESWLVILGGVDDDIFIKVLSAISRCSASILRKITIATNSPTIIQEAEDSGFSSIKTPITISTIYENFSHVISGAGVTAWEMAHLSIPGFTIAVAQNQEFQLNYLQVNYIRQGVNVREEMFEQKLGLLMNSQNPKFGGVQISDWEFKLKQFLSDLGFM